MNPKLIILVALVAVVAIVTVSGEGQRYRVSKRTCSRQDVKEKKQFRATTNGRNCLQCTCVSAARRFPRRRAEANCVPCAASNSSTVAPTTSSTAQSTGVNSVASPAGSEAPTTAPGSEVPTTAPGSEAPATVPVTSTPASGTAATNDAGPVEVAP